MKYSILVILLLCTGNAYAQKSQGDYAVILHGIVRSSSHMEPLAERLVKEGFDVINLDYPSTDHTLSEIITIVNKKLTPQLTKDKPVHFIGYSMGGLVIRGILNQNRPENLGLVIQLASPNHGSEVADFLKKNVVYKAIYGPAGQELTTDSKHLHALLGNVDYDLGVIAGNASIDPISSYIIDGDDDGKVSIASTKIYGMKDHIVVDASHTFFPSNEDVHEQVVYFLRHKKFNRE